MSRILIAMAALSMLRAQSPPTAFQAVSIKANQTGDRATGIFPDPEMLTIRNYSLRLLIQSAYSLRPYQLAGGPAWLDTEHYDIVAKTAAPSNSGQMMTLLIAVLEQRFQLKVHRETRQLPGYVLSVATDGPKLQRPAPGDLDRGGIRTGPGLVVGHRATIDMLAGVLVGNLGTPVVNRAGLEGEFNFELHFTPDRSMLTALRDQLGLQADPANLPVQVTIIDHAQPPVLDK